MKPTDAAWLAGIIDGEGTLQIVESKPKCGGISRTFEANVAVVNTDKRITDRCHLIGGGCCFGPIGRGKAGVWKPAYRWNIKRKQAGKVLEAVLPYLIGKIEQADILLHLIQRTRAGAKFGNCGVVLMGSAEIAHRSELRLAVRALNHRGASDIPFEQIKALAKVRERIKQKEDILFSGCA